MLPKAFTDEVRQQADIIRVVSDYVALKKRGANWIACCPFHSEKTPSFNVHPGKGIYKCFGCSAGGTVFDFIMQIEGCSFPEAVRSVAQRCGIPIPEQEDSTAEARRTDRQRKRLYELNAWACEFFEEQLGAGPEGRRALEYLDERGVTSDTRARLRIGYAPNSWDALSAHLSSRGASREEVADSGLVTMKEGGGGYYDRFRGRVIFPIADAQGKVVAFGGRTLGDDKPKYLNSPETSVYTKGNHLYGLAYAKDGIRKSGFAILVEGYLDCIMLLQEGVENAVASLGTALTEQQARLLRRYMPKPQIVVNYDPDGAGQQATMRSFETLLANGFKINVLSLPGGKDPDDFVRAEGGAAYRLLLRSTVPYLDYVLDRALADHDVTRPAGKADAIEAVLPFIAQIPSPIERLAYVERLADRMRVDDRAIKKELARAASRREVRIHRDVVVPKKALTELERRFLVVLFSDPRVRSFVLPTLEDDDIEGLASEPIFRALRDAHSSGGPVGYPEISEQLSDGARQDLGSLVDMEVDDILVARKGTRDERLRDEATSCLAQIRYQRFQRELEKLTLELKRAESEGDTERYLGLSARKIELGRQLQAAASERR